MPGEPHHRFPVRDIKPNPFRNTERYPFDADKLKALRESIRTTTWWGNIVARVRPDGAPEIAYGHHRLEALRLELGPDEEVSLIVRDLDDEAMLKIMVRENMEEWRTLFTVEQESVRAVVKAYAESKVSLTAPPRRTPKRTIRYAPSFRQGDVSGTSLDHPYTAQAIADYLGWDVTKVTDTLGTLELVERGVLSGEEYRGLSHRQARELTSAIAKIDDPADARYVATQIASKLREGEVTYRDLPGTVAKLLTTGGTLQDTRELGEFDVRRYVRAAANFLRELRAVEAAVEKSRPEGWGELEEQLVEIRGKLDEISTALHRAERRAA